MKPRPFTAVQQAPGMVFHDVRMTLSRYNEDFAARRSKMAVKKRQFNQEQYEAICSVMTEVEKMLDAVLAGIDSITKEQP